MSSFTDAPIVDHSQNTPDVSPSSENEEDQSFIKNPLDFSSAFYGNVEGEHSCFSSSPLCDSKNHEDVDKLPNFLILIVVISLLLHLIMILIQLLLICLRHWSTMIYMSIETP